MIFSIFSSNGLFVKKFLSFHDELKPVIIFGHFILKKGFLDLKLKIWKILRINPEYNHFWIVKTPNFFHWQSCE